MNFILSGRQYDSFLNVVAHDGKLHWYNGSDVVTYDPFDGGQTIFIDGSEIVISRSDPWINRSECLGVCQGFLRCMRLEYAVVGAFHPNNKDVVCLFVFPHFILCNIQSGEFESSIRLYTEKSNTPTKSCQLRSLGGQHQFQRFHTRFQDSDKIFAFFQSILLHSFSFMLMRL
ncbi:hypothetical protein NC651_022955 [Populus alba x Populus x berolinensis]|nr:hypothetical protein NC651_022955 [Populus alba x Populus x berolinensis]